MCLTFIKPSLFAIISIINCYNFQKKTPPSTGRRQVDIQYNSLPRATGATTSTPIQSGANDSVNDTSSNGNSIDSNANLKQRNMVAFGKQLKNIPYSATKSATNIYHHQLVFYQQPDSASIVSPLLNYGSQKQRGVSVPNLGLQSGIIHSIDYNRENFSFVSFCSFILSLINYCCALNFASSF